jgi:thiol-disulfide isomerase/thioredoxin
MRAGLRSLVAVAVASLAATAPAQTPGPAVNLVAASAADILRAVNAPGASVVIVNVWATWCLPCREEMPDILRLRRAYLVRGLRLILVSGDFSTDAEAAAAFLRERGVDFPTYLKNENDMAFINALDPHWSGALPVTFVYGGDGHLRRSIYGLASYDTLKHEVESVLSAAPAAGG